MAAKKSKRNAAAASPAPEQAITTSLAPSTALAPTPKPDFLPLQHYLSQVPLQLAAILFSLVSAASSSTTPKTLITSPSSLLDALVANPVSVLGVSCVAVAFVQAWFGSWARRTRFHALGVGKEKRKVLPPKKGFWGAVGDMKRDAWSLKAPRMEEGKIDLDFSHLSAAGLTTLAATFALHACAVLLGAPLTSKIPETFLLSALVSIIAILPIAIAIPYTERFVWLRLFSSIAPANPLEFALLAPALGAIVGCWAGALPIPLDWDRPWQAWPTTCVVGTLGGHAIGSLVAVVVSCARAW